jgi:membrane protein implicated in regulation of membrane protease activity
MRIAAMIVLAIDLVVATGYMLLFAAGAGVLGLLYMHGDLSLALIVLATWLAVALLGGWLLWRLKKEPVGGRVRVFSSMSCG